MDASIHLPAAEAPVRTSEHTVVHVVDNAALEAHAAADNPHGITLESLGGQPYNPNLDQWARTHPEALLADVEARLSEQHEALVSHTTAAVEKARDLSRVEVLRATQALAEYQSRLAQAKAGFEALAAKAHATVDTVHAKVEAATQEAVSSSAALHEKLAALESRVVEAEKSVYVELVKHRWLFAAVAVVFTLIGRYVR